MRAYPFLSSLLSAPSCHCWRRHRVTLLPFITRHLPSPKACAPGNKLHLPEPQPAHHARSSFVLAHVPAESAQPAPVLEHMAGKEPDDLLGNLATLPCLDNHHPDLSGIGVG